MTMMGIVERLRTFWRLNNCGPGVLLEAAAEIERLRAEIEGLQSSLYAQEAVAPLYAKIERLRAALKDIEWLTSGSAHNYCNCCDEAHDRAKRVLGQEASEK